MQRFKRHVLFNDSRTQRIQSQQLRLIHQTVHRRFDKGLSLLMAVLLPVSRKNRLRGRQQWKPSFQKHIRKDLFFCLEINVDGTFREPSGCGNFRCRRKPTVTLSKEDSGRLEDAFP